MSRTTTGAAQAADTDARELELAKALEALEAERAKAEAAGARVDELEAALTAAGDDPEAKLLAALALAQGQFPTINKNRTGEVRGTTKDGKAYSYTYSYADLGDVLAAVRPVLSRHGLTLLQRVTTKDGRVVLVTELRHASGARLDPSELDLGRDTGNPQAFGGALTYLRRYSAGTYLGVAPEEDTDARDVPVVGRQEAAAPAPAALPPWATDLKKASAGAAELGARLNVLLGEEGAREAARTIKANLGGIPAIVNMTAGLILETILASNPDELVGRLADEQVRRLDAKRKAEAEAAQEAEAVEREEAVAAQAAAEAPDPPAEEDTRTATEKLDAAAEELKAEEAPAADDTPAAGSVRVDISALSGADAERALREAGCICDSPLEAYANEQHRNDECPIAGHGIPF